ncbi:MAG: glycosyltransferase family 1 protein [Planctomycetota bacterium]|nr:MAG: glycosyltransferase family 1 protein [Planctomycetota bacterium]
MGTKSKSKRRTGKNHSLLPRKTKTVKILHVITRSDVLGGAQKHVHELAQAQQKNGHQVLVLFGQKGPLAQAMAQSSIPHRSLQYLVRPIHPLYDPLAFAEIAKYLRQFRPHLLCCHSSKAGWLTRLAGKLHPTPTIFTAHGWAFTEGKPPLQRKLYTTLEKLIAPFTDYVITVSKYDKNLALQQNLLPTNKISVVHNGIHDIPPSFLANPLPSPPKLIMAARFDIPKNQAGLLCALAKLQNLPWTLELWGSGPQKPYLQNLSQRLQLQPKVQFHNWAHQIEKILANAQIYILLSHYEGFPYGILEAMRAGLPILASHVGGIPEAITDGKEGFLIPPNHPELLRKRLQELITSPTLRQNLGQNARKTFLRKFQFHQMYQKTLQIYQSVLQNHLKHKITSPSNPSKKTHQKS